MIYRQHKPQPWLVPYVQCYWTLVGDRLPAQAIFPDGRPELIVQFGDPFEQRKGGPEWLRQSPCVLAGQMLSPVELRCDGRTGSFGIRFHAAAARRFAGLAIVEATERIVPIEADWLRERIGNSQSDEERLMHAEAYLRSCFQAAELSIADAASREIETVGGCLSMGVLARRLGVSPRTLQRSFHAEVGVGPKAFARVIRFQKAVRLLESGRAGVDVALECGYFDQAHMIRDLKELAGGSQPGVAFLQYFDSGNTA